jgi:hypothetical protein
MSDYETNLARIKARSEARIAKMIEEGVSDTPETDAAWIKSAKMDGVDSECFLRNLATKLERDLAAAKALMIEMIAQKSVEAAELRKQRDGLREALEMVRDADNDCEKDGLQRIPPAARCKIDAALASVKEGQS